MSNERVEYPGLGCASCPVKGCDTMQYRGSRCAALRNKHGLGDPQTWAEKIKAMPIEEMGVLLEEIAHGEAPWAKPFRRECCDKCQPVEGTIEATGQKMKLYECDFTDGKCPYGDDIIWWLNRTAADYPRD